MKCLKLLFLPIALFFGCSRSNSEVENPKFQTKLQWLLRHNVKEITVTDLKKLDAAIYLDARSKAEYEVSHVKNSVWVGYDDFDVKKLNDYDKSKNIIVYCSVGYRSEKIAKRLEKDGFKNVHNLYGGLFEWYNSGLEIVDNSGQSTDKIHTYNEDWSQWVTARNNGDLKF